MEGKLYAAKKLPGRIIYPLSDALNVTEVVLVIQEMKGDHESGADARSSHDGGVSGVKLLLKSVLVERFGRFYQGVVRVD